MKKIQSRKILRSMTMIAFAILLLPSCLGLPTYRGGNIALYSLIVDNIPGLVTSRPGNATIEILETDQYGRTLFTYRGDASRYDGYADTLYIYAICQQVKDKNVYYYEDYFYILADSADSFYSEDINELKKINDWELPIDES
ncbi:MAG: hypothetical protein RR716_06260, partial [Christensenellaceae bacterium]